MPIDRITFSSGAAVGADDLATVTGYSPHIAGEILAVHVNYTSAAANPDLVMSDESDPASESILSLANQKTDIKIYPRRLLETNDGTDLTYDGSNKVYGCYVVNGRLEVTFSQADEDDTAVLTVWYRR
jgi:hypothetical protein